MVHFTPFFENENMPLFLTCAWLVWMLNALLKALLEAEFPMFSIQSMILITCYNTYNITGQQNPVQLQIIYNFIYIILHFYYYSLYISFEVSNCAQYFNSKNLSVDVLTNYLHKDTDNYGLKITNNLCMLYTL